MPGRIELIIGPMFAGKTTELMRRVKREIHARRTCFIIKYCRDTRYSDECVSSHDKSVLRATSSVSSLKEVHNDWVNFDVIAIDEGQFFSDIAEFSRRAADAGKTVIISALDGDFQRKPFGKICEMVPMCESISKLTAVCMMCHEREGSFTRRTVSGDQQELIGGAEMYIATCRECFNNPVAPSPRRMIRVRDAIAEVESATMSNGSRNVSPIEPAATTAQVATRIFPFSPVNKVSIDDKRSPLVTKSDVPHSALSADNSPEEPAAKKVRVDAC